MHSHPARVLLQLQHALSCRSTAGSPDRSVRTDLARIRMRSGCSYNYGTTSPVGAPPDRRTAPVRTDPARIRTRGGCSYNYGTPSPVGAPPRCEPVRHIFAPGAGAPTATARPPL